MTLYYARFKHVLSESSTGLEDLMGFFDLNTSREIELQIKTQFSKVFKGIYGEYENSYTLRDFGPMILGEGYKIRSKISEKKSSNAPEESFRDEHGIERTVEDSEMRDHHGQIPS